MIAMSRHRFEQLVRDALTEIPEEFARVLENIAVVVEDEPDPEDLERLGIDDDEELMGLYQGVSLLERDTSYSGLPDRVVIYRWPILRSAETVEDVVHEVTETVIHELGHHLGMGDDEMVF